MNNSYIIKFNIEKTQLDFIIVGGLLYLNNFDDIPFQEEKEYIGENYSLFRIYDIKKENSVIKSLIYSKFPVLLIQLKDKCLGYFFTPVIKESILSIKLSSDDQNILIELLFANHLIAEKEIVHLGLWTNKRLTRFKNESLFIKKYENKHWYDIIYEIVQKDLNSVFETNEIDINADKLKDSLLRVKNFLNRLYDRKNKIHTEFISRNKPISYGGNELYSLTTYEFYRAFYLCRYPILTDDFDKGINILSNLINNKVFYVNIPELNNSVVYYNTIGRNNNGDIYGHTQFNTGLTGYPGGQAAILKILGKFLNEINLPPDFKQIVETRFYRILNFIDYIYSEEGFSYTYPILPTEESELFKSESSPAIFSIGATAEVINAYIEVYSYTQKQVYIDRAIHLLSKINPSGVNSFFKTSGFLRDADMNETDGVSAINLIKANIKIYYILNDIKYKTAAEIIGTYLITFQYMYSHPNLDIKFYVDPMIKSFSPRLGLWDTLLWTDAYFDLFKLTNKYFWLKLYKITLYKAIDMQSKISGGIPESVVFDYINGLKKAEIENGISCWFIKIIKDYFEFKNIDFIKNEEEKINEYDVIKNDLKISYYSDYYILSNYYKTKRFIKKIIPRFLKRKVKQFLPLKIKQVYQHKSYTAVPLFYNNASGTLKNAVFNYLKYDNNVFVNINTVYNNEIIIEKVFFPVITFKKEIIKINKLAFIGNNVTKLEVVFEDFQKIKILISPYGVDDCYNDMNKLVFETTLKSNWNNNGGLELNLKFLNISKIK